MRMIQVSYIATICRSLVKCLQKNELEACMKRLLSTLLALTMALALVSCGKSNPTPNTGSNKTETPSETADTKTEGNVHIGIVTGSVSQSEEDRRGA